MPIKQNSIFHAVSQRNVYCRAGVNSRSFLKQSHHK